MATPATCIQFKPDSNHFALDTLQPGWREIELHPDGRIETRVKRIKQKNIPTEYGGRRILNKVRLKFR